MPGASRARAKVTTGPHQRAGARGERAFSLVELVVVVFLVGIVALIGVPSLQQTLVEYEADHAAAEIQNLMRYARSLSVAGVPHEVDFDVGNSQVSVIEVATGDPAPNPMRTQQDCILQVGEGSRFPHTRLLTADFSGMNRVTFDRLGNASDGGTVEISAGSFTRTVRVTGPGGKVTLE